MISKIATKIDGFYEILPKVNEDTRGVFVKTYQKSDFLNFGIDVNWREQYYSISKKGVLRGLHFQLPPHEHRKLVCCVSGDVIDVALDLRKGSPTYGMHDFVSLSSAKRNAVFVDVGLAHGFYTISDSATLLYNVTTEYAPSSDSGIRWDSAGIIWGDIVPTISQRDQSLEGLQQFKSPFLWTKNEE